MAWAWAQGLWRGSALQGMPPVPVACLDGLGLLAGVVTACGRSEIDDDQSFQQVGIEIRSVPGFAVADLMDEVFDVEGTVSAFPPCEVREERRRCMSVCRRVGPCQYGALSDDASRKVFAKPRRELVGRLKGDRFRYDTQQLHGGIVHSQRNHVTMISAWLGAWRSPSERRPAPLGPISRMAVPRARRGVFG